MHIIRVKHFVIVGEAQTMFGHQHIRWINNDNNNNNNWDECILMDGGCNLLCIYRFKNVSSGTLWLLGFVGMHIA